MRFSSDRRPPGEELLDRCGAVNPSGGILEVMERIESLPNLSFYGGHWAVRTLQKFSSRVRSPLSVLGGLVGLDSYKVEVGGSTPLHPTKDLHHTESYATIEKVRWSNGCRYSIWCMTLNG